MRARFNSYSSKMEIRHAEQREYAEPGVLRLAGDPTTASVTLTTDWSPTKDLKWTRVRSRSRPAPIRHPARTAT